MMAEKIKIMLLKEKCPVASLAKAMGCTPQNLYNKLKRDNFSEHELQYIAKIMKAKLEINFITGKGEKI